MKQPTKSDLAARCRELEKVNGELSAGLHCAMHGGKPEAVERWKHDGWKYEARLYYPNAPHGGIVLLTAATKGQSPGTCVRYLDDYVTERRPAGTPVAEQAAAGRLREARNVANDRQHRGADEFLRDGGGNTSGFGTWQEAD